MSGSVASTVSEAVGRAAGLVLVWAPALGAGSLEAVCALFDHTWPPTGSEDRSGSGGPGVKLLVMVEEGACEGDAQRAVAWCAERGFELLVVCSLTEPASLQAVARHWLAAGAGTPLLSGDSLQSESVDSENSAVRIVEALQCHAWPGLELKKTASEKRAMGSKEETGQKSLKELEKAKKAESGVDEMETLAQQMKEVRALSDDQQRRDRACDLAMRMAASFGIDTDSD
ncbi:unnamed protein product [Polarella glacialis]|uniref:Uncharacterized protein n=1 Tax=Polarella glacialis TaxID=89957 RepID=A0A813HQ84_POLGL|nr:unnamed protein product [Polarella glacialis]